VSTANNQFGGNAMVKKIIVIILFCVFAFFGLKSKHNAPLKTNHPWSGVSKGSYNN